ncbi:MAG: hypothetical protein LBU99_07275, partial [Spirochaetaceae bacterium]|nr:hypothetical protein [Spirochaetaceae bacterium]
MVMSSTVTALAVWAALGGAALFYGKTAGLALVTAVFVFTCIKRRMAVRPRDKNAALRNTAVALILGALVGGWGLYRSAESERPLVSLAPASQIRSISGEVASNAVITGSGRYYRIFLEADEVTTGGYTNGDGKTAAYSAKGRAL